MPLPAPNLDDRRFQDLVDEAKRLVQQRCPEWTDHNVSDPGVTLIETFAMVVDQLLYRLNRVPELNYLRFLDLIGVQPLPPTAARCDVTFWLSSAQDSPVGVPAGTQVATPSDGADPVVFRTDAELAMLPCSLSRVMTAASGAQPLDHTDDLLGGRGLTCFADPPAAGDAVMFGLSTAVPRCAVLLRLECVAEGVGIDPRNPPWVWDAWDGTGWVVCEIDQDTSGGFNRDGDVVLHVPAGHTASLVGRQRAGWLRCRLTRPEPGQSFYQKSPRLTAIAASTIGGTVPALHADAVEDEVIGISEGVPGQRFPLAHHPVIAGDDLVVEAGGEGGWQEWREVKSFARSGPQDHHVVIDRVGGTVMFGPAIREPDGSLRHYGGVPPKAAPIRVPEYRTGGGRRGNVARGLLQVQRDPIPFVSRVTNRGPAAGGVDGESVTDASIRGPLQLRTRDRAVTVEDYEYLAREAAPDVARVRCVPVPEDPGAVRLLVVPAVTNALELQFAELRPPDETLSRIASHLDERRCIGSRISVEPPFYQGVTVVARLRAKPRVAAATLQARAVEALNQYLNPVVGGPEGRGWPFGRPVQSGEVFAVLQRVPGVELIEEVLLFGADPVQGNRGPSVQRLELSPHALVFSYSHQVRIVRE
ncbi:MAG TPA: putative baseplate assembly protein [Pilimelia sp.]|nr:putative baseplate assembly protein [Pilimelia sp.]